MIVEVDESLFPIIIFKSLPVDVSDKDLEEYLLFFENFLIEAKEKIIIIHDINKARFLSTDHMSIICKWSREKEPLFKAKTIGSCVVSSSVLATLTIKAIHFLLKSTFDSEIFSSMEEAMVWSKKQLE